MSYKVRSKDNNQFKVNHAWPGICALCFDEVAEFDGSDENGKPRVSKYTYNYRVKEVELSNDSLMGVTLCKDCAENITEDDYEDLMNSEIKGWEKEIDVCLKDKWGTKEKKYFMDKHTGYTIVKKKVRSKNIKKEKEKATKEKLNGISK